MVISIPESLLVAVFGIFVVFAVLIGLSLLVRLQSVLVAHFTRPKTVVDETFVDAVPAAHVIPVETLPDAVEVALAAAETVEAPVVKEDVAAPPAGELVWTTPHVRGRHSSSRSDTSSAGNNGVETVRSPAPGVVLEIKVDVGATVRRGQILLLLEAMKMENEITASKDGTVTQIMTSKGASVTTGTPLVEIQ